MRPPRFIKSRRSGLDGGLEQSWNSPPFCATVIVQKVAERPQKVSIIKRRYTHYQRVVVALRETICLMKEIDKAIIKRPVDWECLTCELKIWFSFIIKGKGRKNGR